MDYVKRAIRYARDAETNGKHGKYSKLACKRFLNDLAKRKDKDWPYEFSIWHGEDPCWFVEQMPHVEGKWDDPLIKLHDSWIFFIVQLFGWRHKETGLRRFTKGLWCSARKQAKSTVLAPLGLYCQVLDDEPGAQVISAATTGDQARIIWNIAKKMVDKVPDFGETYGVKTYANSIAGFDNNSVFRPINAKASTQDGLNPSATLVDEVHAHETHSLINVIESASGARRNPLFIFVTTEGYNLGNAPWPEMREMAFQILKGVIKAEYFLCLHFAVDEDDDYFDETKWIKASPLMEVNPHLLPRLRSLANDAKHMSGKLPEFKIKRLNIPSESSESFVLLDDWKKCGAPVDIEKLKGRPCWAAIDLSTKKDLCSLRLLFNENGKYQTYGWRWVPEEGLHKSKPTKAILYDGWIESGLLLTTTGKTIDQNEIFKKLLWVKKNFKLLNCAIDEWNALEFIRRMELGGIKHYVFIQGARSYHPAIDKFEVVYSDHLLEHGDDPILNWNADNLVVEYNSNGNMKPSKSKSKNKIDDMVTLLMCFGLSIKTKRPKSFDDVIKNITSVKL